MRSIMSILVLSWLVTAIPAYANQPTHWFDHKENSHSQNDGHSQTEHDSLTEKHSAAAHEQHKTSSEHNGKEGEHEEKHN